MFSYQQIVIYLLAVFISVFPLLLSSQEEDKAKPVNVPGKKQPEKIKNQKVENLTDIKQDTESQPEEKTLPYESDWEKIFRKDLVLQLNEIIQKVQKNYPELSKKLADKKKIEILKSVVATLGRGMEYVSAEKYNSRKIKENEKNDPFPAVMIAANQILYIRIDAISEESFKKLQSDCISNANLSRKPLGMIIDLRSSQSFDYKSAIKALGILAPPQSLLKYNLMTGLKQEIKSPIILLTGKDTSGASEVFAKLLINMKRSISIGEKTAGEPFKKLKVNLSNGDFLMIPQIPDMLADIIPEPVKPSILFSAYPQLPYKQLREVTGAEKNDKCIQRAVELLICLNALGE